MRFAGPLFRSLTPLYAGEPLSGEGAKIKGGRFNPIGKECLYLASTTEGAIKEVNGGFKFKPQTLVAIDVDCDPVADLRTARSRKPLGVLLSDLACPWELDMANKRTPASWTVAEKMEAQGYAGILVPSFASGARRGAFNLVLWRWGLRLPVQTIVVDDEGRLAALKP